MASKKQIAQRKKELTARLADTRRSITREREVLREKLRVKTQVRNFLVKKPKTLFAGSLIVGLLATLLLRRPRHPRRASKTTAQMLFSWILALLKPAAKAWFITRAKKIASTQIATRARHDQALESFNE